MDAVRKLARDAANQARRYELLRRNPPVPLPVCLLALFTACICLGSHSPALNGFGGALVVAVVIHLAVRRELKKWER